MGFSVFVDKQARTVVTKVVEGGAADEAGCQVGGVLLQIDGRSIVAMSQEEVLKLLFEPANKRSVYRSFGFQPPPHQPVGSSDWNVPAFKGDIGRLHVSQRHKVDSLMRPRGIHDVGDENPDALYGA